jgi:replicative DNA helicase
MKPQRTPGKDNGAVPWSPEAEAGLLGSLIVAGEGVAEVLPLVEPSDFFDERHQEIYRAMVSLYEKGISIDEATLAAELGREWAGYLSQLVAMTPTSLHTLSYARVIRDKAISRELIAAAGIIARLGYEEKSPRQALSKAQDVLLKVQKQVGQAYLITPREAVSMARKRYEDIQDKKIGLPFGFSMLDEHTGGFSPGDYVVIGARPGVGKTTLLIHMAKDLAQSKNVLFCSLEMEVVQLLDKLVASKIGKPVQLLRRGSFGDETMEMIRDALSEIEKWGLYFCQGPSMTTATLKGAALQMQMAYGLDAIFVDFLQLFQDEYGENNTQRIGYISRRLKDIATSLRVPLLCASQLSRAPEARLDKRPQLSDLRESGAIEQDADMVLFLFRPDYYRGKSTGKDKKTYVPQEEEGKAELYLAKFRQGQANITQNLTWNKDLQAYQ